MKLHLLCSICIAVLMLSFTANARKKLQPLYDCNGKIAQTIADYNLKKYAKVKSTLENAKIQCGGSQNMDTILFYLGMANLKQKLYVEARSELERVVSDYPDSPLFLEAKFRSAQAVFLQSHASDRDQKETLEAITLFKDFLETSPSGPIADSVKQYLNIANDKIAEKDYNNARFYQKLSEFESAVIYYRAFYNQYPDSKYTDQAKLSTAELLLKLDRKGEAVETLTDLVDHGKDSLIVVKAKDLQKQCDIK